MKKISISEFKYEVPGVWDEISKEQLDYLISLSERNLSIYEIQLKFFFKCIHAVVKKTIGELHFIKTRKANHLLFTDELAAIIEIFDYLFEERDGQRFISPKLTINHYKKIRSGIKMLTGPKDILEDITYNQFVLLQTFQSRMKDNDHPDLLDEFLNVIYTTRLGKQKVKNIRRIAENKKIAILWMYIGSLSFLENMFPRVFSGESSGGNVFDNQQRIIDLMAGGDVTKKNQVRDSLLYDAMYSMEMAAIRIEEIEKQRR